MFMKYFELLILAGALLFGAGVWFCYMRRLKKAFYRAMLLQSLTKLRQKNESLILFSDYVLMRAANMLLGCSKVEIKKMFAALQASDGSLLVDYITGKNKALGLGVLAHFAPDKARKKLSDILKVMPDNNELLLLSAHFQAVRFDYAALEKTLNEIKASNLSAIAKAEFWLLTAKLAVYKSDMEAAVKLLGKAGSVFKRCRCYYSESEVYFTAGEIYRACAISDVSQMMFETAGNIAVKISGKNGEAKALAAKGMLMAGQNRFDEAADFFKQSRQIFSQAGFVKSEAEIINQQALLFLMRGKLAMALRYAEKALNMHKQCRNAAGEGQSAEIMAMAAFRQKKYAESLEYALAAQKVYEQTKNYTAYFDAAFLEIQALFAQNRLDVAQKRCVEVLRLTKKYPTGFYVADIYSFLGMIYLRQEKLIEAKKMFCRSAALESACRRDAGLVSDYVNLALIEHKFNHAKKAKDYAEKALKAAKRTGDDELYAEINKQIGRIC